MVGSPFAMLHVGIEPLVDAIVEKAVLELLEMVGGVRGAEQPLAQVRVRVHRAADVHQQQQLDAVSPRRPEHKLDLSAVAGAVVDRVVQFAVPRGLRL